MKSSTKSPKATKSTKSVHHNKDGYGAHWHVVGWLAAVAIVLSASTMTLGASASSGPSDEASQLDRIEARLDLIEQHLGTAQ